MKYIELAFVVVCIVAVLQALGRRLPVPMAALQIAAGFALSAVAKLDDLREQTALLFTMLVPPLLYIEAWQAPKRELLRAIRPILGLAIGLVAVTIAVVGLALHTMLPAMPVAVAFALAAALASTDTVAVSAVANRMALPPRLQVLLCGEGLFNDAVALVAFKLAVVAAVTAQFSFGAAAQSLVTVSIGGLLTGGAVAGVAHGLRRVLAASTPEGVRCDTVLSLLIPYAAYLAGEKLGVSGVLAVVAAGLCGGLLDRRHLRASTRLNGVALWRTVTLTLNGAVFVMMGLVMRQVLHRVEGHSRWDLLGIVALLTLTLFALRMGWTALMAAWSGRSAAGGDGSAFELPGGDRALRRARIAGTQRDAVDPAADRRRRGHAGARSGCLHRGGHHRCDAAAQRPGHALAAGRAGGRRARRTSAPRACTWPSPAWRCRSIDGERLEAVSTRARDWAATWERLYESRIAALDPSDAGASDAHRCDLACPARAVDDVLRRSATNSSACTPPARSATPSCRTSRSNSISRKSHWTSSIAAAAPDEIAAMRLPCAIDAGWRTRARIVSGPAPHRSSTFRPETPLQPSGPGQQRWQPARRTHRHGPMGQRREPCPSSTAAMAVAHRRAEQPQFVFERRLRPRRPDGGTANVGPTAAMPRVCLKPNYP